MSLCLDLLFSFEELFKRVCTFVKLIERSFSFRLISKAGAISEKKLDEFLGWFPIMKKRSEEGSDLGPDAMAIERQLQECKVRSVIF